MQNFFLRKVHSRPAGAAAPRRGGPLEVTVRDPVLLHASRARRSVGPGYVRVVRYSAVKTLLKAVFKSCKRKTENFCKSLA